MSAEAWIALIGILTGVLTVLVTGVFGMLWMLTKAVGQINGKFTGMKVWAEEHEKRDDERFDEIKERLAARPGP